MVASSCCSAWLRCSSGSLPGPAWPPTSESALGESVIGTANGRQARPHMLAIRADGRHASYRRLSPTVGAGITALSRCSADVDEPDIEAHSLRTNSRNVD